MAIARLQIAFPSVGADTEDTVVNSWYFDVDDATIAGVVNAQAAVDTFYTSIKSYLSVKQDWLNGYAKWYNMADPERRVPFAEGVFIVSGSPSAGCLPPELAICLSYQGVKMSGSSQARRRGRIYLGPLGNNAISTTSGEVASGAVTAVVAAAQTLLTASGLGDWTWVLYSRTSGSSVLIDNGWVDNAPDIQRRRGIDPSARTTFS
jgi:hypothetical protein